MKQSRLESLLESFVNILIGYIISFCSMLFVFPLVGLDVPIMIQVEISVYMTFVSVARSYYVRRWFNAGLHRQIAIMASKFASK